MIGGHYVWTNAGHSWGGCSLLFSEEKMNKDPVEDGIGTAKVQPTSLSQSLDRHINQRRHRLYLVCGNIGEKLTSVLTGVKVTPQSILFAFAVWEKDIDLTE